MMGGFSESQLGSRIWRVNFISNPGRTPDEVKDMILLRSAELVTAAGFDRFVVVQASDQSLITGVVGVTAVSGGLLASIFTPMRNPDISAVIEARPRSAVREVEYDPHFLMQSLGPRYGLRASARPIDRDAPVPPPQPAQPPNLTTTVKPIGLSDAPGRAAAAAPPAPVGKDSAVAERLARDTGCIRDALATMIGKGPGYESYSFQCSNGETLVVRCEWGNCRTLK